MKNKQTTEEASFNKRRRTILNYGYIDANGNTVLHHRVSEKSDVTYVDYLVKMHPGLLKILNNKGMRPLDVAVDVFSTENRNSRENLFLLISSGEKLSLENLRHLAKSGLTQDEFSKIISEESLEIVENITSPAFTDKLLEKEKQTDLSLNGEEFLDKFLERSLGKDDSNILMVFETQKIAEPTLIMEEEIFKVSVMPVDKRGHRRSVAVGKPKPALPVDKNIPKVIVDLKGELPTLFVAASTPKVNADLGKSKPSLFLL